MWEQTRGQENKKELEKVLTTGEGRRQSTLCAPPALATAGVAALCLESCGKDCWEGKGNSELYNHWDPAPDS